MITLVFDCIRSPYDLANVVQVVLAVGPDRCDVHITGSSLRHDHHKVAGKVASWSRQIRESGLPALPIRYHNSLEECVGVLRASGTRLIGTSPRATKSVFEFDLSGDNNAVVFGTETSGLTQAKIATLDDMAFVPMSDTLDFMTLSVCVPVVAYEALRQQRVRAAS